ncbi:hypothetical protein OH76DRAFT_1406149 [Lentinus brumalis]|uniref:Uncharacterized protein n=1 Tax=Lentinus brumalis TaxID=2498619 RepID=A0A371D435_9APHY|nr:hypothetical protein OH76DRAFT_1406149 [Polyporus brumalis]
MPSSHDRVAREPMSPIHFRPPKPQRASALDHSCPEMFLCTSKSAIDRSVARLPSLLPSAM